MLFGEREGLELKSPEYAQKINMYPFMSSDDYYIFTSLKYIISVCVLGFGCSCTQKCRDNELYTNRKRNRGVGCQGELYDSCQIFVLRIIIIIINYNACLCCRNN